jgi:DNA-binding XRE family transcriptional regulator
MDVGIRLRKYRIAKGYSQQFVADWLDISRNAYMAKEDNKVDLSSRQLIKVCELYEVSIDIFLNIDSH